MKHFIAFIFVMTLFICVLYAAPVDKKDNEKDSKSAFGPAFDEIVVESHLTVRRKSNSGRQGRTNEATTQLSTGIIKTKRDIKSDYKLKKVRQPKQFGASAAHAQSQAFNSVGPLGSFGASASSSQSQSFGFGKNGFLGSAGFSGTQQYNFNGQTVDISIGNGGAVVETGATGKKRIVG